MFVNRLYSISKDDHVVAALDILASDDKEAVTVANDRIESHDIEIWQSKRVVAYLLPKQKVS